MVFENIYEAGWVEKHRLISFLLGLVYALFGIFAAKLIFGGNPGLMSVAFCSMLLMPLLAKLLSNKEESEIKRKKFSLGGIFKDHKSIFVIYFFIFMGIFVTYAFFTIIWSNQFSLSVFEPQLKVAGFAGKAIDFKNPYLFSRFVSILTNNIKVLVVCLVLSFFFGAGSILFLAWNASVWGAVFGFVARQSAMSSGLNPFFAFGKTMLPVLPHMFTEAASYLTAAIAGGILSKAVLQEKFGTKKYNIVLKDTLVFLVLGFLIVIAAAFLEVYVFPLLNSIG